jgi:DNA helicase-2/ATP-dependent DNA helicase PcrA
MLRLDLLNDPQREAVLHADGALVVFAGAGSGKTRVITHRVAHLVLEKNVRPWRILSVTFTNKAAGEMRERLGHLLGGAARDLWIGTFHSTCAKLMRAHHELLGLPKNFVIYDDGDQKAMLTRVINDLGYDDKRFEPKKVAQAISKQKQELRDPNEMKSFDVWHEIVKKIYHSYEERMLRAGALDFDDLIYRVVRYADAIPAFREAITSRFDYVLVDEFQDTNRSQFKLVELFVERAGNLCVVGDDDQSIYRWRGADRRNILDFRRTFPNADVIKLEQNYRSTQRILRAAHAVVSKNLEREPKTLWTDNDEGAPVLVLTARDERDEARLAVEAIRESVRAGREYSDVALFYRIHAQSRVYEEALRAANIPYRIVGGTRFYDRAEVKDVLAYLRVLTLPNDDVSVLRVVNVPARGIGKTSLDRLLDVALQGGVSVWAAICGEVDGRTTLGKKFAPFVELVEALKKRIERGEGPHAIASAIADETGYRKMLRDEDTPEADARLENIAELLGSMKEFEEEAEEPTISAFLETVTLASDVDRDKATERVTLMTVHAAKGLEFPVVFVGGLEEKMFPYRGVELGEDPEELEEERRLAYVAFTRARERLVLSWAPLRRMFGQARISARSRFLDELPKGDIEEIGAPPPPPASSYSSRGGGYGGYDSYGGSSRGSSPSPAYRAPARPSAPPARISNESYIDRSDGGDEDGLRIGMRVAHAKYGVGQINAVAPGVPPKVTVTFPGWGTKQIVASFLSPA